jgi:hypothetical protein
VPGIRFFSISAAEAAHPLSAAKAAHPLSAAKAAHPLSAAEAAEAAEAAVQERGRGLDHLGLADDGLRAGEPRGDRPRDRRREQ